MPDITMMLLVVLLGLLVGAAGFAPLFFVARTRNEFMRDRVIQFGIVSVALSLVLMFVAFLICSRVASGVLPFFGLSAILMFICMTLVYAIRHVWRR